MEREGTPLMQYVMVVDWPDDLVEGDDSIEAVASDINELLSFFGSPLTVRPLSEVIAS